MLPSKPQELTWAEGRPPHGPIQLLKQSWHFPRLSQRPQSNKHRYSPRNVLFTLFPGAPFPAPFLRKSLFFLRLEIKWGWILYALHPLQKKIKQKVFIHTSDWVKTERNTTITPRPENEPPTKRSRAAVQQRAFLPTLPATSLEGNKRKEKKKKR